MKQLLEISNFVLLYKAPTELRSQFSSAIANDNVILAVQDNCFFTVVPIGSATLTEYLNEGDLSPEDSGQYSLAMRSHVVFEVKGGSAVIMQDNNSPIILEEGMYVRDFRYPYDTIQERNLSYLEMVRNSPYLSLLTDLRINIASKLEEAGLEKAAAQKAMLLEESEETTTS